MHPKIAKGSSNPLRALPLGARRVLSLWGKNVIKVSLSSGREAILLEKHKVVTFQRGKEKGQPRGIIAKYVKLGGNTVGEYWVFYPPKKEILEFVEAHKALAPDGPSEDYPGSVGTVNTLTCGGRTEVKFMQTHFQLKKRSLAKKSFEKICWLEILHS